MDGKTRDFSTVSSVLAQALGGAWLRKVRRRGRHGVCAPSPRPCGERVGVRGAELRQCDDSRNGSRRRPLTPTRLRPSGYGGASPPPLSAEASAKADEGGEGVPALRREGAQAPCSDHNDLCVGRCRKQPRDLAGAALEREPLIDVALVGDLVGVDRGRVAEQK